MFNGSLIIYLMDVFFISTGSASKLFTAENRTFWGSANILLLWVSKRLNKTDSSCEEQQPN